MVLTALREGQKCDICQGIEKAYSDRYLLGKSWVEFLSDQRHKQVPVKFEQGKGGLQELIFLIPPDPVVESSRKSSSRVV